MVGPRKELRADDALPVVTAISKHCARDNEATPTRQPGVCSPSLKSERGAWQRGEVAPLAPTPKRPDPMRGSLPDSPIAAPGGVPESGRRRNDREAKHHRILTTHAGSLPRPRRPRWRMNRRRPRRRARRRGRPRRPRSAAPSPRSCGSRSRPASTSSTTASTARSAGSQLRRRAPRRLRADASAALPGRISQQGRRDRKLFPDFYRDELPSQRRHAAPSVPAVCTGPITYTGQDADPARHRQLQGGAARAARYVEGVPPRRRARAASGTARTSTTRRDEEFLFAIADAMHEEYKAIVDAGFVLQIDDPGLPDTLGHARPRAQPSRSTASSPSMRVEALNHALRGIPEDRVRYHICWGSWHGPHTNDIPLRDIVDLVLKVKAQAYSIEAAQPAPRARVEGLAGHRSCRTARSSSPASSATPPTSSSTRSSSPSASSGTPTSSAARTSSPAPTAVWAAASTPRSPGPSSRRSREGAALASKQLWGR